jgi:hypothetical protein
MTAELTKTPNELRKHANLPPIETLRHGHPRFYQLLDELAELHSRKNHDYAGRGDPLRNFRMCEAMGIPAWKACLVRITDKLSRLQSFAASETLMVEDESMEDTARDLAVYALILLILYQERSR